MIFLGCQDENDLFRQEMNDQLGDQLTLSGSNSKMIDPIEEEFEYCGTAIEKDLIAGRKFMVGNLEVGNDDEYIYLTFTALDNWAFSEIHVYVGSKDNLPIGNGKNPKIGKFPFVDSIDPIESVLKYKILQSELEEYIEEEEPVMIVAQAVVQDIDDELNCKTAFAQWDEEYQFSGARWGGGFLYEFVECEEGSSAETTTEDEEVTNGEEPAEGEPAGEEEETGGETEVTDLTTFSFIQDTYSLKIKDLNELQEVGNVRFYFEEGYLKVEYSLIPESGWLIKEVHINIGSLEAAFIGNNENLGVGLFTYVEHYVTPFQITQTYSILVEDLSAYYVPPDDLCETFTVHATLVDASDNTIQKSSFVVWNENLDITGSKWYDSFDLCLVPPTE